MSTRLGYYTGDQSESKKPPPSPPPPTTPPTQNPRLFQGDSKSSFVDVPPPRTRQPPENVSIPKISKTEYGFFQGEESKSPFVNVPPPRNRQTYDSSELVEIFKSNYNESDINDEYVATNICNPVTARLIIFFKDNLMPFVKNEYNSKTIEVENKEIYNKYVIYAFIFFYNIIFFYNFSKYNFNEQKWITLQKNIILKMLDSDQALKNETNERTKFVDSIERGPSIDSISGSTSTSEQPINLDFIYDLYILPKQLDNFRILFLNFIRIVETFDRQYYLTNFKNIHIFVTNDPILINLSTIPDKKGFIPVSINIRNYSFPISLYNFNLLKFIVEHINLDNISYINTFIEKEYPYLNLELSKMIQLKNDSQDIKFSNSTWDFIFASKGASEGGSKVGNTNKDSVESSENYNVKVQQDDVQNVKLQEEQNTEVSQNVALPQIKIRDQFTFKNNSQETIDWFNKLQTKINFQDVVTWIVFQKPESGKDSIEFTIRYYKKDYETDGKNVNISINDLKKYLENSRVHRYEGGGSKNNKKQTIHKNKIIRRKKTYKRKVN